MILYILLIIIETFGIYNLKKQNLFLGTICYILVAYLLYELLINSHAGFLNVTWNIFTSISVLLVGYMFMNEKIKPYQYVGIILGITGLLLINL